MKNVRFLLIALSFVSIVVVILIAKRPDQTKNILHKDYLYYNTRFSIVDDLTHSTIDFNDENWDNEFPYDERFFWFRCKLNIKTDMDDFRKRGLQIVMRASYSIYWDGVLIGKNGAETLTKNDEVPGFYQQLFFIPDHLSQKGAHQISMRISRHNSGVTGFPKIRSGDYQVLSQEPLIITIFIHIAIGVFFAAFVYFLFLAWSKGQRQLHHILFAILNFLLMLLTVFEYLKFYVMYLYPFQDIRVQIIQILVVLVSLVLPLYVHRLLNRPYLKSNMSIITFTLVIILFLGDTYDSRAFHLILISIVSTLALAVWGLYDGIKASKETLIAVLILSSCLFLYFDLFLFIGFAILVLILFYQQSQDIKEKEIYLKQSILKAKRLEVELLKKQIEPHFLMNTLTSLINVIEEDSEFAVECIHRLAKLYEIINEVSDKPLISLKTEIELCRAHIDIMQFRKDIECTLQVDSVEDVYLPPAVLLTVIENGFSHNKAIDGKMAFSINYKSDNKSQIYQVVSHGQPKQSKDNYSFGLGFTYIKSRLDESFKNKWQFKSEAIENGWQTLIEVYT